MWRCDNEVDRFPSSSSSLVRTSCVCSEDATSSSFNMPLSPQSPAETITEHFSKTWNFVIARMLMVSHLGPLAFFFSLFISLVRQKKIHESICLRGNLRSSQWKQCEFPYDKTNWHYTVFTFHQNVFRWALTDIEMWEGVWGEDENRETHCANFGRMIYAHLSFSTISLSLSLSLSLSSRYTFRLWPHRSCARHKSIWLLGMKRSIF